MKRQSSKTRKAWVTLDRNISIDKFNELVRPLNGLPISRAWRGYGSALFLELGKLTRKGYPLGRPKGAAGVMIEWSWRVETQRGIRFGSFNTNARMDRGINTLAGKIECISLFGRLPEISIQLSGGKWISSFKTADGQPDWVIFLLDQTWMTVRRGHIFRECSRVNRTLSKAKRH